MKRRTPQCSRKIAVSGRFAARRIPVEEPHSPVGWMKRRRRTHLNLAEHKPSHSGSVRRSLTPIFLNTAHRAACAGRSQIAVTLGGPPCSEETAFSLLRTVSAFLFSSWATGCNPKTLCNRLSRLPREARVQRVDVGVWRCVCGVSCAPAVRAFGACVCLCSVTAFGGQHAPAVHHKAVPRGTEQSAITDAATKTVPPVFGIGNDPVTNDLVRSPSARSSIS